MNLKDLLTHSCLFWTAVSPPLLREGEVHCNRGYDGHRLAVQQRRLIAPLLHSINGRLNQQRVTRNDFKVVDGSFLADFGFQNDDTLNSSLFRQRRINRLDLRKQISGLDVSTHSNALRRVGGGRGGGGGGGGGGAWCFLGLLRAPPGTPVNTPTSTRRHTTPP